MFTQDESDASQVKVNFSKGDKSSIETGKDGTNEKSTPSSRDLENLQISSDSAAFSERKISRYLH